MTRHRADKLLFNTKQVKVDNKGIAAVAYNTKVKEGFTLGLGASFDTQKINEGSHKVSNVPPSMICFDLLDTV